MRLQFGLRTLLLIFLLVGFCFFIFRDGCELREYNQVRKNMPATGISWKYEQFDEGLLFTLVANQEPIEGFEVEVKDDQGQVLYNSGFLSGDSRYALKFFVCKNTKGFKEVNSPENITVILPETLHGAEYKFIINPLSNVYPNYGYFLEGSGVLHILDQNRREYWLWISQRAKSDLTKSKGSNP